MPALDDGRHAIKRVVGDELVVEADIFKDGHDRLAAQARWCGPDGAWHTTSLRYDYDSDRWLARIPLDRAGAWAFTVEAWMSSTSTRPPRVTVRVPVPVSTIGSVPGACQLLMVRS